MKLLSNKLMVLSGFIILIVFTQTQLKAQQITWLGTLGGEQSIAYDLTNDGIAVVGTSENSNLDSRAFSWMQASGMQSLNTLQNIKSGALGISQDGSIIVGYGYVNSTNYQAFYWTNGTGVQFLGTIGGSGSSNNSRSFSCSSDGSMIVGKTSISNNNFHAFKWSSANGMEDLGVLNGGSFSGAYDVSENGNVIVGYSDGGSGYSKPCYWLNGSIYELFTSAPTSAELGEAYGVSKNGTYIAGYINDSTTNNYSHGYLWILANGATGVDMGTLTGPLQGECIAYAISNSRQVVGKSKNENNQWSAFYWYEGVYEDLNITYSGLITSGSRLLAARNITPDGRYIVGEGFNISTGNMEAFLLDRGSSTSVETQKESPDNFSLEQNYPNPFNPSTLISWQLPVGSRQILKVYDLLGNEVATLVDEYRDAGRYEVEFDASGLSSGVYFYKLTAGSFTQTKKMTLIK